MSARAGIRARVRARRCAVQALYQWQVAGQEPRDILAEFVADRELISVDMDYFSDLTRNIPAQIEVLRADLEPLLDRAWAQLDVVERSVLLIGAFEMRNCLEIPFRVVINEGVELCKIFGTVDGHKYVNGVLDKLAMQRRAAEVSALI